MNALFLLGLLRSHRETSTIKTKKPQKEQGGGCPFTVNELRQMHGLPPLQAHKKEEDTKK